MTAAMPAYDLEYTGNASSTSADGLLQTILQGMEEEARRARIRVLPFIQEGVPLPPRTGVAFRRYLDLFLRSSLSAAGRGGTTLSVRFWSTEGEFQLAVSHDGGATPDDEVDALRQSGKALGIRLDVERGAGPWNRGLLYYPVRPPDPEGPHPEGSPACDGRTGVRILIVDDSDSLRDVVRRLLERRGHEVVEADTVPFALSLLEELEFDRILVDVNMPGRGGIDFYRTLESRAPAMARRAVFMTGGFQTMESEDFILGSGRPTMMKPFDLAEVVRVVEG